MTIGERIRVRREALKMSQEELALKLGYKSRSSINKIEKDGRELRQNKIVAIASALNTTPAYIMGWEEEDDYEFLEKKTLKGIQIPVLGRVQAGLPIDAVEEILDYEEITPEMATNGDYFGLQVKGDSMEPKFSEGDVVIVRQQSDAETGDIVIALVNGDEATIKKLVKYEGGGIALVASNPLYAPLRFSEDEITSKPVSIIGKVVELRAKF
ncbi:LexA family protein [Senimuribacter intestinalis]|uniref:LexA family protein n=1 Tax=Senimuribacter intestinalis TaxID=2941507 RepID=UPI00203AFCDA|nr:LexA family transcriptional regulator [Senimuribacter intestinalis]